MDASRDRDLTRLLSALASETRLQLLRDLRSPKRICEIRLLAPQGDRLRPLARQTVRQHLDTLVSAGLVQTKTVTTERGPVTSFRTDEQGLIRLLGVVNDLAAGA